MSSEISKPFTWRGIEFTWHHHRSAMYGTFLVDDRQHWILVQEPSHFLAWIEWADGYTRPCTMPERIDALEGARVELLDCARHYHEELVKRLG